MLSISNTMNDNSNYGHVLMDLFPYAEYNFSLVSVYNGSESEDVISSSTTNEDGKEPLILLKRKAFQLTFLYMCTYIILYVMLWLIKASSIKNM